MSGEVIALLAGSQRQVFPLEQFFDGRPAAGISDVVEVAKIRDALGFG